MMKQILCDIPMKSRLWAFPFLLISISFAQPNAPWIPQTYIQGPADNPLKGFMPYKGVYTTLPHSMEYTYISWKDIQTDYNTFTWNTVDAFLTEASGRGHHSVFRVYADYPKKAYGVPQFLDTIPRHAYTDYSNTTSYSPDYDNSNLRQAMLNTIAALGARYDGDSRIGFIEVGFLGFWGEWHTFPHNDWFASIATQNMILDAFEQAFRKTKILMREPKPGTDMNGRAIGYHDDSFAYSTYGTVDGASWYFWPKVIAAGEGRKWKTQPIGGELRPEIQLTIWNDSCLCTNGESGLAMQYYNMCVDSTHASWLLAGNLFSPGNTGTPHIRTLAGARRLGYDLFVSSVALPNVVPSDSIRICIRIQNRGVAPFYYPWHLQLGLANEVKTVVAVWETRWELMGVIDTSDVTFSHTQQPAGLLNGTYTLLLRAVDPMPGGKSLAFANASWGRDVADWLSLGSFNVTGTAAVNRSSDGSIPRTCSLEQNFPNPFNPVTTIRYAVAGLPAPKESDRTGQSGPQSPLVSNVRLAVCDLLGCEVAVLADGNKEPGIYEVQFDASRLPSGVYICRLNAGGHIQSKKIVLVH
jgi:hypothetical protein